MTRSSIVTGRLGDHTGLFFLFFLIASGSICMYYSMLDHVWVGYIIAGVGLWIFYRWSEVYE